MKSVRRGKRILITMAGPATFEVPWKKDAQYVIALFEEDQNTGAVVALRSFQVTGVVATARLRPYQSDFVRTWNLGVNQSSLYSERVWDLAPADLASLPWDSGRLSQVIYVDFTATTNENDLIFTRALEDADGNFVFPLRVFQSMNEVPP